MVVRLPFLVELKFENVGFKESGKPELPREKPLRARERTNNKPNPHMALMPGFEPGSLCGEASAHPLRHPCSPKRPYRGIRA